MAEIARINVASWQHAYRGIVADEMLDQMDSGRRVPGWDRWLRRPDPEAVFVAEDRTGRIGAYCGVSVVCRDEDAPRGLYTGELVALYGDPAMWGTGAGKAVHDTGLEHLSNSGFQHVVLWVFGANALARNFYRSQGWQDDHVVRDHEVGGQRIPVCRYSRSLPAGLSQAC